MVDDTDEIDIFLKVARLECSEDACVPIEHSMFKSFFRAFFCRDLFSLRYLFGGVEYIIAPISVVLSEDAPQVIIRLLTILDHFSLLSKNLLNVLFSDLPLEIHYLLLHFIFYKNSIL